MKAVLTFTISDVTPKEYTIPFELYGDGTINDEVEPCVLVDGEWKCRVTRRWGTPDPTRLDWNLSEPVVELYDPIPIRTLPISTVLDSNLELKCNIKTVDRR